MNCYLLSKTTLHINLHILVMILFKASLKIQESWKSYDYIKRYIYIKFVILEQLVYCFLYHLNLNLLRFTGEPMTQCTHLSHANVNTVGM